MQAPPLLPAETYLRVVRLAHLDGMAVLLIAGGFAALAALGRNFEGVVIGLAIAAAGAVELHGAGLLRAGEPRGYPWIVASQPYLLLMLVAYCAFRWAAPELPPVPAELQATVEANAAQVGMAPEEYLMLGYRTVYALVALVSFFYQGGMTLYYLRRRDTVLAALEQDPDSIA